MESSPPEAAAASASTPPPASKSTTAQQGSSFSFISWNLDGLDSKNLIERTQAVLQLILRENPAIIFFQELVPQTYDILAAGLSVKYLPICGTSTPIKSCPAPSSYFVATFLRTDTVSYEKHVVIPFKNSIMDRKLLITHVQIGSSSSSRSSSSAIKLILLNTHLESCARSAKSRGEQLRFCFELCGELESSSYVNLLFGGDLNLGDDGGEEPFSIPPGMVDVWEATGSDESSRYTWDLRKNANKQMPGLELEEREKQPKFRFDRFYFREAPAAAAAAPPLKPESFSLLGMDQVEGTDSFPSDHWAIKLTFTTTTTETATDSTGTAGDGSQNVRGSHRTETDKNHQPQPAVMTLDLLMRINEISATGSTKPSCRRCRTTSDKSNLFQCNLA